MGAAKRLYLYGVSAISLLILAIGLYLLVAVVLGELGDAFGASVIGSGATGREQISLAIALVLVAGPVFAIHWWLIGRGLRGTDEAAVDDRRSGLRAFHLGFVATVALAFAALATLELIDRVLGTLLGVPDRGQGPATDDLAMLIVAIPIWRFHWGLRTLELRRGRQAGAIGLARLHRYGWAFAGLMMLVVGSSQVLQTVASVLIGREGFGSADRWWLEPLSWSISVMIVGAILFAIHADDARRAIAEAVAIGEDERPSAVRGVYFGLVQLVVLGYIAVTLASVIAELGRLVLGVAVDASLPGLLERVVGPLIVAVPFVAAGWLHWTYQRREAAERGPVALADAERVALHLSAIVGLTFLAVGAARMIGRFLELVLGGTVGDDFFRYETAWFIGQLVVGAAFWAPAWAAILRRRAMDAPAERRATVTRAYLYLVVAAALLAAIPSAAFVLFRLIDTVLGGGGAGFGLEVPLPIAVVVVAGVVAAYHGRIVIMDLRAEAPAPGATPATVASTTPAVTLTAGPAGASLDLVLRGEDGTDLTAVADALRQHLPPGVVLEGR